MYIYIIIYIYVYIHICGLSSHIRAKYSCDYVTITMWQLEHLGTDPGSKSMAMQTINVEEGYMYTYVYIHVHLCIFMQTTCIYVEESYMYIMHTCTFMYIRVYSCRLHYFIYVEGGYMYIVCV